MTEHALTAAARPLVARYSQATVPTEYGPLTTVVFREAADPACAPVEHVALVAGSLAGEAPVLTRIHSECWTGEVMHSHKCDCREQLDVALRSIAQKGRGVVLYLRQEGRGIGLGNKIRAYALQDEQGLDTLEANHALGFADDLRSFAVAAQMLRALGVGTVRLLTNNPHKVQALQADGIRVAERVPMQVTRNPHNERYLTTKIQRMGHEIPR